MTTLFVFTWWQFHQRPISSFSLQSLLLLKEAQYPSTIAVLRLPKKNLTYSMNLSVES